VTGGSGFIGTHIIEELQSRGHSVKVFDRRIPKVKGAEWLDGDLRWAGDCDRAVRNTDAILHLAARISVDESLDYIWHYFNDNLMSTVNLFMAAAKHEVNHILFTCYDEETLAFTSEGLKHYSELKIGDRVLSLDENGMIWNDRVTAIQTFPFDGDMIHFKGKSVDLLVTPNHRMLFRGQDRKQLVRIEEAANLSRRARFWLPSGRWEGQKLTHFRVGSNECDAESLFYLLGLYIGDGVSDRQVKVIPSKSGITHSDHVRIMRDPTTQRFIEAPAGAGPNKTIQMVSYRNYIYIPDSDKSRKRVESALAALGIKFTLQARKDMGSVIYFGSKDLAELLGQCGHSASDKHVPRWAFAYDTGCLRALLGGIIDRDGSPNGARSQQLTTVSWRLVNNIIELGTKLGMGVSVKEYLRTTRLKGRVIDTHGYWIGLRTTEKGLTKRNVSRQHYEGTVWCATVERNHNLLVYRKGKTTFSGNSSCEVYGETPRSGATEEAPCNPTSPYAASKYAAERAALTFKRVHPGLKLAVLRPFNTFGEWQKPYRAGAVIPTFILEALKDRALKIHGKGDQTRDYVYVKDIARGHVDVMEKEREGIFNIATGRARTINSIAKSIVDAVGKGTIEHVPDTRKGAQLKYSVGDASKIEAQTGWRPVSKFEPTLRRVIEWYQTNDPLAPAS
jgi:nucleoside-diphosphate-sugar epimerase